MGKFKKAAGAANKAATPTPAQLEKEVMTHHAKTVYFNGLWKDFLTKACAMVGGISGYHGYAILTETGLHFSLAFELMSLCTSLLTVFFLHRISKPLLIFKLAFSLALIQLGWYALQVYNLRVHNVKGELGKDQIPMGAMCFLFAWASDRYMMRSEAQAQKATAENPVWADVQRVPQDDGPNPAVPINYSAYYRDVMDLFRAVLLSDELSERTLTLTEAVIECNAANYTAWHFRRKVLKALNSNLGDELEFCSDKALENPKNYQIWHHRREIVDRFNDPQFELPFIAEALDDDSKNYHCWAYRQWVVARFNLWAGELAFVDEMLEKDMRNNSAWNHRWFVTHHEPPTAIVRAQEIEVAFRFIAKAPHNESAWNYLRGWLEHQDLTDLPIVESTCEALYAAHPTCTFAANVLVDIYAAEPSPTRVAKAIEILDALRLTDPVRAPYWEYLQRGLPTAA
ncbi:protein farnesyltransferase/geranylgeranyltransferase [Achlya hypogyna]|uniref:Protein farnesyltransferase/geranylgeranyltransferase type-1 subunit alpha n=1 Tax=Achlya hypogyna TaxID=1202772 RepID=A0A1V9YXS2_ACHHY|nr:protein farnesyltransferase/geranylgeranyltransferase [Achlya hypogyna]